MSLAWLLQLWVGIYLTLQQQADSLGTVVNLNGFTSFAALTIQPTVF